MTIALLLDGLTLLCLIAGLGFFIAGTVGFLRFPDVYNRLHAMTKADNVGLGLIVLGLSVQSSSPLRILKLIFIWSLVLVAGATSAHLIARTSLRGGISPWKRR